MKNFKVYLSFLVVNFLFYSSSATAQGKFQTSIEKESILIGSGSVLLLSSILLEKNLSITPQEILLLKKDDINFIDRSAVNYYSKNLSLASDVLLITSVLLPTSFLVMNEAKNDLNEIGIMYLETLTLTYGITNLTKNIFQRFRPYAYNNSIEISEKIDSDTKKSFFSGHTSTSFASAVFFSSVFSELSSDEEAKTLVWIGSLSLASATGLLRYFSGKHFPTDILAGAVVGSFIGYTIPKLHKVSNSQDIKYTVNQNSFSIIINFDSKFLK